MAFALLKKTAAFGVAAPATRSRKALTVRAAGANAAEARQWIAAWRNKQAARANLPNWFPGSTRPDYLDASLPGDFGFDPLRLGADPATLRWYAQAELVHSRFAMLAAAGILLPELLTNIGFPWPGNNVAWYDAGAYKYFAPTSTLALVQFFLMAWAEIRRYQDIQKPGSANQDPIFSNNKLPDGNEVGYPGGIFDPFGYSRGKNMSELKLKEIKNGRLAMCAVIGFFVQHQTTGTTPLANLSKHLADPWNTTVFNNEIARL